MSRYILPPEPSNPPETISGLKMAIISGTSLSAISSPLSVNETILWEESQRLDYSYDTLYSLWGCEAQWRHEGIFGDNYLAYGAFQWHFQSWEFYTRILDRRDFNILSFKDQIDLTILVLQRGDWWNWKNCAQKIGSF